MLNPKSQRLAARFRCPECRTGSIVVHERGETLSCAACARTYDVRDGAPVLLSTRSARALGRELESATGRSMVAEYDALAAGVRAKRPLAQRLYGFLRPPGLLYHNNPDLRAEATERLYDHRGADTLVLNVGGGPTRYRDSEITMNLEAFANVDVIGDAHDPPFKDDTFDSIVCNAVLEHVHDAERVVDEMVRILRPGGYLYAEVPFMFFFHGYPNDFRRYTREGMRRLFAGLDNLQIGIVIGPASAMLQSLNVLTQMFVPRRIPYLRKVVNGGFRWITFPLKYLDIALLKREEAHLLAGGFCAYGRKPRQDGDDTTTAAR